MIYEQLRFIPGGGVLETIDVDGNIDEVYTQRRAPGGRGSDTSAPLPGPPPAGDQGSLLRGCGDRGRREGLLLDFDVAQSFGHPAGRSGLWVMNPVIAGTPGDPEDANR